MAYCAVLFFQYVQSECSFTRNLNTKFCLHTAGGIYVLHNFANSGGKIDVAGSSTEYVGGGLWEINSRV